MDNDNIPLATSLLKAIEDAKEAYQVITKVATSQTSTSDLYIARDGLSSIISRLDTLFAFYRTDLPHPDPPKKGWVDGVKSIIS